LEPSKLDGKTRKSLDGMVKTHAGLAPAVLAILTAYNSAHEKALSQPQDSLQAKEAIARVLEIPYHQSVEMVKGLLLREQNSRRLVLAQQWRDMAHECGAQPVVEPYPSPAPDPGPRPTPAPTPDPSPAPVPSPAPADRNAELLKILNSNDPRQWYIVMDTPLDQRSSWSQEVHARVLERVSDITVHRRKMEELMRGLDRDPRGVEARFDVWLPDHSWVCCWDPKKSDWVDVDAIKQAIERAVATLEAQNYLKEAQRKRDAGESFDKVITAIDHGLEFTKAESEVIKELQKMKAHFASVDRGGIHSGSMPIAGHSSNRTTSSAGDIQRDTLRRMLERPLEDSQTLTELRERLHGLLQNSTIHAQTIKAQYDSLQVWEQEEKWLLKAEQDRANGGRLDERTKSHAATTIMNLDALTKMDHWRPYIPTDRPTVFATTKGRLQVIAAQQRVAARRQESSSYTSFR
jgi:hypothetical protein